MEARVEKPHRIAGYCRISVDVEADRDNTSIENQKDIISDYVQRYFPENELTFFVDRDRSGYTFEQREDYQRMRPYLMTGQYDILISRTDAGSVPCRMGIRRQTMDWFSLSG